MASRDADAMRVAMADVDAAIAAGKGDDAVWADLDKAVGLGGSVVMPVTDMGIVILHQLDRDAGHLLHSLQDVQAAAPTIAF